MPQFNKPLGKTVDHELSSVIGVLKCVIREGISVVGKVDPDSTSVDLPIDLSDAFQRCSVGGELPLVLVAAFIPSP
jgi:hypothetical protein